MKASRGLFCKVPEIDYIGLFVLKTIVAVSSYFNLWCPIFFSILPESAWGLKVTPRQRNPGISNLVGTLFRRNMTYIQTFLFPSISLTKCFTIAFVPPMSCVPQDCLLQTPMYRTKSIAKWNASNGFWLVTIQAFAIRSCADGRTNFAGILIVVNVLKMYVLCFSTDVVVFCSTSDQHGVWGNAAKKQAYGPILEFATSGSKSSRAFSFFL